MAFTKRLAKPIHWRLLNLLQMKDLEKEFNRLLLNRAQQIIGARVVGLPSTPL